MGSLNKEYKLFIGSSSESLKTAHRIKDKLNKQAKKDKFNLVSYVWDDYPEKDDYANENFTEKFDRVLSIYDFALFVLSDDDILFTRGEKLQATRDNVWLEAGMFIGRKGIKNVFLFLNLNDFDISQIPSDLKGIILNGVNWNTDILRLFYSDSKLFTKTKNANGIHYEISKRVSEKIDKEIERYCNKVIKQLKNRVKDATETNLAKILLGRKECYNAGLMLIKSAEEQLYTTISFKDSLKRNDKLERDMYNALLEKLKTSDENDDFIFRRYFQTDNPNITNQREQLEGVLKELGKEDELIRKILIEFDFDYLELIISDNNILMVFPNYSGQEFEKHNRVEFGFLIEHNRNLAEKLRDWLLVKVGDMNHT